MPDIPQQQGDPKGYRIAARRASYLAEAGAVTALVKSLLLKAGEDTSVIDGLLASLKYTENRELVKAVGRLESRVRFESLPSSPLHEQHDLLNLYVDEAGVSHPEPGNPGAMFAIGSVALYDGAVERYVAEADDLKQRFWGHTNITFHEPDMRNHSGAFHFGDDRSKQTEFDEVTCPHNLYHLLC